jgi:hypothetical protein
LPGPLIFEEVGDYQHHGSMMSYFQVVFIFLRCRCSFVGSLRLFQYIQALFIYKTLNFELIYFFFKNQPPVVADTAFPGRILLVEQQVSLPLFLVKTETDIQATFHVAPSRLTEASRLTLHKQCQAGAPKGHRQLGNNYDSF